MNYKVKRYKAGLTPYTVAKELGIDYEKYQLVERKKLPLEGNLVDKFLSIIDPSNAKMIRINHTQRITEVKEFAKSGKLKELMKTRGYYKQVELAKAMGISNTEISRAINYGETTLQPSDCTLERVYDFLMNPINANVDKENTEDRVPTEEEKAKIKKFMEENNLNAAELASKLGYDRKTIENIYGKKNYLSPKAKAKLFEYMEEHKTKVEEVIEEVPVVEDMTITSSVEEMERTKVKVVEETPTPIVEEVKFEEEVIETGEENNKDFFREWGRLVRENFQLKSELEKAQTQLRRYEKLIDRM